MGPEPVRLDKWLWASRFFKTRSLAQEAIENGRVLLADDEGDPSLRVKPARSVRVGDRVRVRIGDTHKDVVVRGLSERRGPANVAQTLYEETAESIARRAKEQEERKLVLDPVRTEKGRPTKRDRREIDRLAGGVWGAEGRRRSEAPNVRGED